VVIIFGIMLTQSVDGPSTEFFNRQSIFAAPLAVAAAALVAVILVSSDLLDAGDKALNPGVNKFSELLFNRYVFPFELISLLLLAAMVGAIVLARKEERQ
jgi:NADH-quinone oxidoreductase subunit J